MGDAGFVLAANLKKASPAGDLSILWAALWVVAALLLGAAIITYVKNWRQRPVSFHLSTSEELARYRVLYERGELSADEFGRIESRLNERLRHEMKLPAAGAAQAPDAAGLRAAERPLPPAGVPKPVEAPTGNIEGNGVPQPPPADPNNPQT